MNSCSKFLRQYVVYPICWTGSMINNLGLTAFGIKKAAEFFFGQEKDLTDSDVSAAFAIFLLCTFNVARRIRIPRLRSQILSEQYEPEEKNEEELIEDENEDEVVDSSYRDYIGTGVSYILKGFGKITIVTNFLNNVLSATSLYNYFYQKAYHSDQPTNEIGENIFALCVAATSIGIYVTFNIHEASRTADKVGKFIRKGTKGLHIEKDKTYHRSIGLLTANAVTIPFMAYLSSRHALPKLPWIGPFISERTNVALSIFSAFIFVTTRTCSVGKSTYDFFAKPCDWECDLDKLLTYVTGFGDSVGTSIGTLVAYCHLLKEAYDYFIGPVSDPDNFWDFHDFINNFGWGGFSCGLVVGGVAGFVGFVFSSIQGLEKAKITEERLSKEYRSKKWLPSTTFNVGLFRNRSSFNPALRQPLLPDDEKFEYKISLPTGRNAIN